METKANPSPTGCYARALPDEPMFMLLARDRCAPDAIRHWADTRSKLAIAEGWSEDAERITDALETADGMETWRIANDGAWRASSAEATAVWEPDLGAIAERVSRRGKAMGILPAAIPDSGLKMVSVESFNTLLADAQKLAAFVLQRETACG